MTREEFYSIFVDIIGFAYPRLSNEILYYYSLNPDKAYCRLFAPDELLAFHIEMPYGLFQFQIKVKSFEYAIRMSDEIRFHGDTFWNPWLREVVVGQENYLNIIKRHVSR